MKGYISLLIMIMLLTSSLYSHPSFQSDEEDGIHFFDLDIDQFVVCKYVPLVEYKHSDFLFFVEYQNEKINVHFLLHQRTFILPIRAYFLPKRLNVGKEGTKRTVFLYLRPFEDRHRLSHTLNKQKSFSKIHAYPIFKVGWQA